MFQSESTPNSYLNVKEMLARTRRDMSNLSDFNRTPTHNHLVFKGTLKHFAELAKSFRSVVSTYLYGVFDCMLL